MKEYLLGLVHQMAQMAGVRDNPEIPWWIWPMFLVGIIISTTVHEFGHAWMADKLGDPGPREQGRVSLNPAKHYDPLGFALMCVTTLLGVPLGWGKPVKTDPEKLRIGRRLGMALVAAAGPLMNLATAILFSVLIRLVMRGAIGDLPEWFIYVFIGMMVSLIVNVLVFAENLIPVHPMDASHIIAALLPAGISKYYVDFMQKYGFIVLLALSLTGVLAKFLMPIVEFLLKLLLPIG
jgi:Zn-dependent protease